MPKDDSSVERLKQKLYRRGQKPQQKPRRDLHDIEHEALPDDWEEHKEVNEEGKEIEDPKKLLEDLYEGHLPGDEYTQEPEILHDKQFQKGARADGDEKQAVMARIIRAVFVVSLLFFMCAIMFAAYIFLKGTNQISCKNVTISVVGPQTIASGKKLSLDVNVENKNPVAMRNTQLEVIFPEGTKSGYNSSFAMPSIRKEIGSIEPGERPVRTTVDALLFGQEMSNHEIRSIVTFGIDDSDAEFTCEDNYRISLTTAPVSVSVEGLEEISSGQELDLEVFVTSNSEEIVPYLRLVTDYPFGFEFISSEPEPFYEDNVWEIGDLSPLTERVIKIKGVVRGQGIEARTIGVDVGEIDATDKESLATTLAKVDHPILITRPFLAIEAEINGSADAQVVTQLKKTILLDVKWKNTTGNALHDVELDAVLNGVMLDPTSVDVQRGGYFRSYDNTVTWTPQTTDEKFRVIEPGEQGTLRVVFNTNEFEKRTSLQNPSMNISFNARARRISDNIPVPESLLDQAQKTILFDSDVLFDSYILYSTGEFTNTGPFPPKVDDETTFTVVWRVSNTTNDIDSGVVRGELPVFVEWMDEYSKGETVTFNPVTREVIWSVGNLPRATGYETPVKELQFQISVIPSASQINTFLKLLNETTFQGVDSFTNNVIKRSVPYVDSRLERDPFYKNTRDPKVKQ